MASDIISGMLEAIALLAPSLIALKFYNHLQHNTLDAKSLVMSYGIFVVAINLCIYSTVLYILEYDTVEFTDINFVKYLITALVLALILPFVIRLIESTISVRVIRQNDEE